VPEPETKARLRKLLIEAEQQRQAIHEYQQTAYREKVEQHATRLAALYENSRALSGARSADPQERPAGAALRVTALGSPGCRGGARRTEHPGSATRRTSWVVGRNGRRR
jgi:hypothetical protein